MEKTMIAMEKLMKIFLFLANSVLLEQVLADKKESISARLLVLM